MYCCSKDYNCFVVIGGHGLSAFGDIATFKNGQISLSDCGHQKFNRLESAQKFHASRD